MGHVTKRSRKFNSDFVKPYHLDADEHCYSFECLVCGEVVRSKSFKHIKRVSDNHVCEHLETLRQA
jgi:hypothetical protein